MARSRLGAPGVIFIDVLGPPVTRVEVDARASAGARPRRERGVPSPCRSPPFSNDGILRAGSRGWYRAVSHSSKISQLSLRRE